MIFTKILLGVILHVEYKMRYADYMYATYGGKVNPEADKIYSEVGYLTSSIMKRFRYMCTTYRETTRIGDFMAHKFNENDLLNSNHLVQSAYHEILVLRDLLNVALDKKEALEKKERAMQFFMEFQRKEKTYTPKTRSKGSREPVRRRADGDGDKKKKDEDVKKAEKKFKEDLGKGKKKWRAGQEI